MNYPIVGKTPGQMAYSEQLQDPRWKGKSLQIKERDNFTCQRCGKQRCELHVHHRYYFPEIDPWPAAWEYPQEMLVTLCKACHTEETKNKEAYDKTMTPEFIDTMKLTFFYSDILKFTKAMKKKLSVRKPGKEIIESGEMMKQFCNILHGQSIGQQGLEL